jgi:hypothetical protein
MESLQLRPNQFLKKSAQNQNQKFIFIGNNYPNHTFRFKKVSIKKKIKKTVLQSVNVQREQFLITNKNEKMDFKCY